MTAKLMESIIVALSSQFVGDKVRNTEVQKYMIGVGRLEDGTALTWLRSRVEGGWWIVRVRLVRN